LNNEVIAVPSTDRATPSRVLIAEPDECLLAEYQEYMADDFEVVTALNGLECVACLRDFVQDVLVLEPQLPWGGGDGVLTIMKMVAELAIIPVMILTSCRDVVILRSVAPFPISDYCVKPLTPAQLTKRIRNVLEFRGRRINSTEKSNSLNWRTERRAGKVEIEP